MRDTGETVALIIGYLAIAVGLVLVSALIVTLVWAWLVPVIFTGAVSGGYLPASLTIVQAIKLSILFWGLGLTGATSSSAKASGHYDSCLEKIAIWFIAMLIVALIVLPIAGLIIMLVWNWVVPDVFAGMVAHGVLPAVIGFWHAVGVAILFSVLGLSSHTSSSKS